MLSFDGETAEDRRRAGCVPALLALALCMLLAGPASAAAPNWLEPADLSKPGRNASNPAVAMDAAGNTVAIWERQSTVDPSFNLQISTRAAGGTFTAPVDFALKSTEPQVAMSAGGEAVAVWKHFENPPGVYVIQMATPAAGGAFSAPVTVYTAPPGVIPQEPQGRRSGAGGDVAVTWSRLDPNSGLDKIICGDRPEHALPFNCPNPGFVEASVRPAGGSPTPAQRISAPRGTEPGGGDSERQRRTGKSRIGSRPRAALARSSTPAGNTTVVFSAFNGEDNVIQTAYRARGRRLHRPGPGLRIGRGRGPRGYRRRRRRQRDRDLGREIDGAARMVQAAIKARPEGRSRRSGDALRPGGTAERPVLGVAPERATATLVWRLTGISGSFLQVVDAAPRRRVLGRR